MSQTLE